MSRVELWADRNQSSNFFGYLWDEISGRNARDEQNEFNKQQSLEAYQRDLAMWRMQNDYNTPSSQMARYQAAGLNPLLIYGQGNPGNASGSPSYHPASGASRPSGMETLSKVANVIGMLVGLKGNLASAEVASQNAKRLALEYSYLPDWLRLRNIGREWSNDVMRGRGLEYWTPSFYDENGKHEWFRSWQELYDAHPEEFVRTPAYYNFLDREQKYMNRRILLNYQDEFQQSELSRLRQINALLSKQNQFFKLDKYIGYATDALGSLLQIGNFGLGVGKFNVFKKMHGF